MNRPLRTGFQGNLTAFLLVCTVCGTGISASAADWPTWRYDAGRTAASPQELAAELHLQWIRHLPPPKPAWPKYPRLCFDGCYEPVVLGKTMFVPSMVTDSVTALDTATGERRWIFYTDGPVRLAPLAFDGKVCFVSDDGHLYCLDAAEGKLLWKVRGLPAGRKDRKVLGNDRMISLWPARGGPVLADGTIYFAAGVWPFEGVYVHAVDAKSGKLIWSNGEIADIELGLVDHGMRQDTGLSPQGYLAMIGGKLIVPSGRALPGVLDPKTGKLQPYVTGWGGRDDLQKGCWYVSGNGKYFFQSGDVYDAATHQRMQIDPANAKELGDFRDPIFTHQALYFSRPVNQQVGYRPVGTGHEGIVAWDLTQPPEITTRQDSQGKKWTVTNFKELWSLRSELKVHLKAGGRLYGGAEGVVAAVELPDPDGPPKTSWKAEVDGTPARMLAADDKLFVITREGAVYAFGPEKVQRRIHEIRLPTPVPGTGDPVRMAAAALKCTEANEGYCLVLGAGAETLVKDLIGQSRFHVIVVEPDAEKAAELRRTLDEAGLYGQRVAVLPGDLPSLRLPPYFADLIISEAPPGDEKLVKNLFGLLRPYGGVACLGISESGRDELAGLIESARLPGAKVDRTDDFVLLTREGALSGSADWTHEDADAGSSLVSRDGLVKPPFGMLWFGGSIDMVFPEWDYTHSHPATALVAGGRIFFQVLPYLHARDIYTGRHLWTVTMPGAVANSRRNVPYAAAEDSVYFLSGRTCYRVDAATGSTLAKFDCPTEPEADGWREVRIWNDRLIATAGNVLVCLDRQNGETKWEYRAQDMLGAFAVGDEQVFCADVSMPSRRDDQTQLEGRLMALDAQSGKNLWHTEVKLTAAKQPPLRLVYCDANDVLLTVYGSISACAGKDGSSLWSGKNVEGGYQPILHRERLITQVGEVLDPLTGAPLPRLWDIQKRGCTRIIGGEHQVNIRHGQASYLDFASGRQTFFRGVRVGCTNSLIPAGGLINAPDFSHGCACNYPVFASCALMPVPQTDE